MSNPELSSLGGLRKIMKDLEDLPDNTMILAQVVGKNKGAWNMHSYFGRVLGNPKMLVVTLSHPQLKRLPEWVESSETLLDTMDDTDYIIAVGKLAEAIKQLPFNPPGWLIDALNHLIRHETVPACALFKENSAFLSWELEFKAIAEWVSKHELDKYKP